MHRLDEAVINYIELFMLGTLGREWWKESAKASAKLINETKPKIVWLQAMRSFPGSELHEKIQNGQFIPAYELEILQEENEFIKLIDKDDLLFLGIHPINVVTAQGRLPGEKQNMIARIDNAIEEIGEEQLKIVVE